jgi:hypothetical protein
MVIHACMQLIYSSMTRTDCGFSPLNGFIAGKSRSSKYSINECVLNLSSGFLKIQLASTPSLDIAEITE